MSRFTELLDRAADVCLLLGLLFIAILSGLGLVMLWKALNLVM